MVVQEPFAAGHLELLLVDLHVGLHVVTAPNIYSQSKVWTYTKDHYLRKLRKYERLPKMTL